MAPQRQKTLQGSLPLKKGYQIFKYPEEPMAAQSRPGPGSGPPGNPRQGRRSTQMTGRILELAPVLLKSLTH